MKEVVKILGEIRDSVRETNSRLDGVGADLGSRIDRLGTDLGDRIDETNRRVDGVERRIVSSEIRIGTYLAGLAAATQDMSAQLHSLTGLTPRVERCEKEILELKKHAGLK